MKKLAYTAALALVGLSLSAPAMANIQYQPASGMESRACRVDSDGERHCWNRYHHWRADRQLVVQQGQDVNSITWADGSVRATLPPHNVRGSSRPDTGIDDTYWLNY